MRVQNSLAVGLVSLAVFWGCGSDGNGIGTQNTGGNAGMPSGTAGATAGAGMAGVSGTGGGLGGAAAGASGSGGAAGAGAGGGTAGVGGAAGAAGSGGTSGSGGAAGAAGSGGTSGAGGSAGAAGSGGTSGAGGMAGAGGTSGTGGMAGTGGTAMCSSDSSCYGGAATELTVPMTACRAGTRYCVSGALGQCIGEVRPGTESCNGIDDDCNGAIDNGLGTIACGVGACANTAPACVGGNPGACTPKAAIAEICGNGIDDDCDGLIDDGCACTHVAPSGSDNSGTGSTGSPFRTIAKGIASAGTNGLPMQVCVASGTSCPSAATYAEALTMRDGVSVYGGYRDQGNPWTRIGGCVTTIGNQDANGVTFPATVGNPTILDGFTVNAHNDPTNAAITVTGSTGAVISNDIVNGNAGTVSVGILVQNAGATAATPTIRTSAVTGGTGSSLAIGVRAINSAPKLSGNCGTYDNAGRCTSWGCFNTSLFIRGRSAGNTGAAASETYAVRLENSPNTVIDTSALCSSNGQGNVAGLRISGDATGVLIRQNQIVAPGGNTGNVNGVGVWMDACNGASPWILDNSVISGQSRTAGGRADGIRAVGDCHPRIDSNLRIVGGEESSNNDAIGVYCARDAGTGTSSRCTVLDNLLIRGSGAGFPPTAAGVKCDAGACTRIERNTISGNQGINTFGVILNGASTFVDRNVIDAGCTRGVGIGLQSINSSARVQNNVIRGGGSCAAGTPTAAFGVQVLVGAGNELDLHSNHVFGHGAAGNGCASHGLSLGLIAGIAAPSSPVGVVRNNIIHAGLCGTSHAVQETAAATDPRIFERNDLWPASPTALYVNEGTTNPTTSVQVNALMDMTVAGIISADPLFVSGVNLHITGGSPCRNTGTAASAPLTDWDGDARPQEATPDIGADEFKP